MADEASKVGRIKVTPLVVPHRDEFSETVGFRIEGPNRAALFLPDIDKWGKWDRKIEDEIKKVDIAMIDGTFFGDGELPGRNMSEIPHPFIEESLTRLGRLAPAEKKKVYFIHMNHTNPALQKEKRRKTENSLSRFSNCRSGDENRIVIMRLQSIKATKTDKQFLSCS